ncbi:hypothetical protein MASR2M78_11660 [Treponema sp.]
MGIKNWLLYFKGLSAVAAASLALVSSLLGGLGVLALGWAGLIFSPLILAALALLLFGHLRKRKTSASVQAVLSQREEAPISLDRLDSLTGLANSNGLSAWFHEKAAHLAADGKNLIVMVARLDGYEAIVKSRGQEVADAVLKEVASRVAVVAGGEGIAARTDGEEFAAVVSVVPSKSEALVQEKAGHLVDIIGRPVEHSSGAIWIGGSVGAAFCPPSEGEQALLLARKALAEALKRGRGHHVVYKA